MKLLIILLALSQTACAYTAVSTVSLVTTGKSTTDHLASTLANADCNAVQVVVNNSKHSYYCEQRDIGQTYNRNSF